MGRYIIEGTCSGCKSVVHRSVHVDTERVLHAWTVMAKSITRADGSKLVLTVRPCMPYERVKQNLGYMSLIRDCAHYNVCCVADLMAEQAAARDKKGK
jgi:chitinase